ncbi:hypothetical protein D0501_00075 [Leuconostoc holzapfelii]|uniref:MFS transporter n=1 Tax=Leuconostoc holzapfelii TaxID=434464 RepID=A0ABT2NTL4_9LACO|nr:hypothetical protein [Leuconostoc holzapfelii]MCT8388502.1 hypothetical protein [Leuconostoc holzapfelii]
MENKFMVVGKSALAILSSTIIVLPFMLLVQLSNGKTFLTVLPFVLFYTFRMTGIFFIRGIKTKLNSFNLLRISLYCGLLGCIFGMVGTLYFPAYVFAGFFLGLSGAWLPPANTVIGQYLKKNGMGVASKGLFSALILVLIGASLMLPSDYKNFVFFAIYGVMYVLSFQTIKIIDSYEVDSHDMEEASYLYTILFAVFFILLFVLRSSRLLNNAIYFDYFINSFFLIGLIGVVLISFFRNKVQRHISNDLMFLTFINGAVGNYLFLFSSLYTAAYYGRNQAFLYFYLPYVLGNVLAPKFAPMLKQHVKRDSFIGIVGGLLIILLTPLFPIGLFIVSTFKGTLNGWLTREYSDKEVIPADKRIWVKYTLQNIGSILHQFLLMFIASVIIMKAGRSIQTFFVMTTAKWPTPESMRVMREWNDVATGLVIAAIVGYILIFSYKRKVK